MNRYLLDTDVLSDLVRDPRGRVAAHVIDRGEANVTTDVIVAGELRFGAARSGSIMLTERVEGLLDRIEVMTLDEDVAHRYAAVRHHLERAGTVIGPNDMWIAAHALAAECILVTGNERAFGRVDGLRVENWRAGP